MIGGYAAEMFTNWLEVFDDEILILAMKEAIENDAKNWRYLNRVLSNWKDKGVKTVNDAKAAIVEFRDNQKRKYQSKKQNHSTEVIPEWFEDRDQQKLKKEKTEENDTNDVEIQKIIEKYKTNVG